MTNADPLESFGPRPNESVFSLMYEDKGTRGASRNQITMDTKKRLAVVWSDNLPPFKVEIALPVESDPTEPVARRLSRAGAVAAATGNAPAKAGDRCELAALPNGHHAVCVAEVACAGRRIVERSDAVTCTYADARPASVSRAKDGLEVAVDGDAATIRVPGERGYELRVALDPAR
ncbi:MAG TPA: hypothetical protein VHB21_08990, partial [Minicystis sp.]|nr:hypothetical protein [Minicystis sp.]